jgi:hypothetical protein
MLTQERLKELFSYNQDTGLFVRIVATSNCIKVGDIAGCNCKNGYLKIGIDGEEHLSHRLAWLYVYGIWPAKQLDHINGIRNDNRISNLREATNSENAQNIRNPPTHNKSGYLGVSFSKEKKKWVAHISINDKSKYLGYYASPELAHDAYLAAKRIYHPFGTL